MLVDTFSAAQPDRTSKDWRCGEKNAARQRRQQKKEWQAKAYITDRCSEKPDVTCQELRQGLRSTGIPMSAKHVNSIRRELGLQRPSGSRAEHLRSSSVHAQARDWLAEQRHQDPDVRVHTLQANLRGTFGIEIGTRQLNNILRELGVSRPGPHRSKVKANKSTSALDSKAPARQGERTDTKLNG